MAALEEFGIARDGATVTLDMEALIGSHLCIQANAGGGKSRTIRKIMELAEGHAQRIILDVEDEFHTLREASPRMVIAGPDGDCPATVANAAALCTFILETGVDAVVQINQLGIDGRRDFIAAFLTALIGAPRRLWHPALVVVDETHRYCPQAGRESSSDAVIALASEGRKRGFTAIFATQRMAKIDKDATGDVNNWMMGRAGQANDRERCADELGLRKSSPEIRELGRLHPGNFWVIGPALTPEPVLMHVGAVKTTHLRSGQRGVPVPPAPDEIRAMMAKLHVAPAAEPESAKESVPRAPSQAELSAARATGARDAARDLVQLVRARLSAVRTELQSISEQVHGAGESALGLMEELDNTLNANGFGGGAAGRVEAIKADLASLRVEPEPAKRSGNGTGSGHAGGTKPVLDRVRGALAELHAMGVAGPERELVAFLAGYSNITSKPFAQALSALQSAAEIESAGVGCIRLTPAGRQRAGTTERLTGDRLRRRIVELLGSPTDRVLECLMGAFPHAIERETLARRVGYTNVTSKPFAEALGKLGKLGFVHRPEVGKISASPVLFQD